MKGKVDVTESRVDELKAELSRKTTEAQLLKVMQTDTSPQRKKEYSQRRIPNMYVPDFNFFLLMQNEVEVASAENDLLKKTCEAAEKAKEDLVENSTVKEVFTQFSFFFSFFFFCCTYHLSPTPTLSLDNYYIIKNILFYISYCIKYVTSLH